MRKPLPIGISDYKNLIKKGYYYVDKTLFIQELLQTGGAATLICRPRRFGKTLNLSMLHYFFEKTDESNAYLFEDKAIWQDENCRKHQGQYPVIFITFKDVKETTWNAAREKIIFYIMQEYKRHQNFIENNKQNIGQIDYDIFQNILTGKASDAHLSNSLYFLTMILASITKKEIVLLLDEYDAPIHAAYSNGYYNEIISFMRGFLSAGLKDNKYLERAVLTGILRTAKEGIFSGLNNLNVCTLLHDTFADKFGFTTQEVDILLADQGITFESETVKQWYNGYHMGEDVLVYNPWSIIQCAQNKGRLIAYWVNTSDNLIVKKLIAQATEENKKDLEQLLLGRPPRKIVNEAFSFSEIENAHDAIWNLLLFSGYLTFSERDIVEGRYECSLTIPNSEIKILYKDLIQSIFRQSLTTATPALLLTALQTGDADRFSKILQEFVINSMSYYDFSSDEPEKSYHLFALGMLVLLSDTYHVRSNRESGYGRYDLMLIPKDTTKSGIIIEFKKATSDDSKTLEKTVDQALEQIQKNRYAQELRAQSIQNILIYAAAFYGKKLLVKLITTNNNAV